MPFTNLILMMTDLNPVDAMTTDYRAMCAELVDKLHEHTSMWEGHEIDLVARARALLAQPEPEGPTDEQIMERPQPYGPLHY